MISCRVCSGRKLSKVFHQRQPCVSSVKTLVSTDMELYHCCDCNHVQVLNSIDVASFYDQDYDISLDSEQHDQLHKNAAGQYVERTKLQADVLARFIDADRPLNVLEFGSGKAQTLWHLQGIRSIQPFVFDVSKSYKPYWDRWIPEKNQAIYHIPGGWKKKFHVICLHYVLEHVPNPVEVLKNLQHLLKDDGVIYISVPNFLKNVGDIFVVDHINKFTAESIDETARLAGYRIESMSTSDLDNAFSCTLKSAAGVIEPTSVVSKSIKEIRNYLDRQKSLLDQIRDADHGDRFAVFGAGFYGTLLASLKMGNIDCFLDNNPHLTGRALFEKPILLPEECPDHIDSVVFAVNPAIADQIIRITKEQLPKGKNLLRLV